MGIEFGDIAESDSKIVLHFDIKCAVVILLKGMQIIPLNQMYITPNVFQSSYEKDFLFTWTRRDTAECCIFVHVMEPRIAYLRYQIELF